MKTIYVPVNVFDDQKYCNDQNNQCERLFRGQCEQFFKNLKHKFPETGKDEYQKCPECKVLYNDDESDDHHPFCNTKNVPMKDCKRCSELYIKG